MIKLRGQSFVVRQNQRRAADFLDHLGHGEGLAGAGDAQQHLVLFAIEMPRVSCSMADGWSPRG